MTLLREIQDAAASDSVAVAVVLRKCKILARRIKSTDFSNWVNFELEGYPFPVPVPSYRLMVDPINEGNFQSISGEMSMGTGVPVFLLPEGVRQHFVPGYWLRLSIVHYEDMLNYKDEKGMPFKLAWPNDVVSELPLMWSHDSQQGKCVHMWTLLPPGTVASLLSSVRNKILDFTLDIEAENPDAGEAPANSTPIPEPIVQNIFNNTFHGSVGNVSVAGQNYSQQVESKM